MKPSSESVREFLGILFLGWGMACVGTTSALAGAGTPAKEEIRIIQIEGGTVEIIPAGAAKGVQTSITNQVLRPGDRVRTGPNTRIAIRWPDQTVVPFDASTELEIVSPDGPDAVDRMSGGALRAGGRGPGR